MKGKNGKHPLDRDLSPGLRFPALDMSKVRQLTEHLVQSTAVHSRSRGWLPMVKVDLHHRPLAFGHADEVQVLELVIAPDELKKFIAGLQEGMKRARADAEHGLG